MYVASLKRKTLVRPWKPLEISVEIRSKLHCLIARSLILTTDDKRVYLRPYCGECKAKVARNYGRKEEHLCPQL